MKNTKNKKFLKFLKNI